jgi:hypothetical protein
MLIDHEGCQPRRYANRPPQRVEAAAKCQLIDTSSSQGYSAAAGSDSGGPLQNSASIFFGTAEIGGSTLSNSPTITPSSSAVPAAAVGGGGISQPAAGSTGGIPANYGTSGFSFTTVLIVAALLVGGAIVIHITRKHA